MAYNSFEGRSFDTPDRRQAGRPPHRNTPHYYELSQTHPRNRQIIAALKELQIELGKHMSVHEVDPDDLFEWNLEDPEFWKKYIGYSGLIKRPGRHPPRAKRLPHRARSDYRSQNGMSSSDAGAGVLALGARPTTL